MVNHINIDHIDPYFDGDLRNLKHAIDDENGYTKHSHSSTDQKRIYYIKLKKQMQRDEQIAKQMQNVVIKSDESDSDSGKYKKKKKAEKHEQPDQKKKSKKK